MFRKILKNRNENLESLDVIVSQIMHISVFGLSKINAFKNGVYEYSIDMMGEAYINVADDLFKRLGSIEIMECVMSKYEINIICKEGDILTFRKDNWSRLTKDALLDKIEKLYLKCPIINMQKYKCIINENSDINKHIISDEIVSWCNFQNEIANLFNNLEEKYIETISDKNSLIFKDLL